MYFTFSETVLYLPKQKLGCDYMFPENLRYLREKFNMEQIELANKLGKKSPSTISEWEKGKYTPRIGVLNYIAEIFNVSISDLMNTDLRNSVNTSDDDFFSIYKRLDYQRKKKVIVFAKNQLADQKKPKTTSLADYHRIEETHEIYLQSKVSAGTGILDLDSEYKEEITYTGKLPQYYDMAFAVAGDSMRPVFEDGEIIFVEKMDYPINGAIMVVQIDEEAFVKKVYIEENDLRLVSLNKNYKDIYADSRNDIRIVGKVIM